MDDLVQWLSDQLDEDAETAEAAAAAAYGAHWYAHAHQTGSRAAKEYVGASTDPTVSRSDSKPISVLRPELTQHIARHDPAQVLREIEAKRQLLDDYAVTARIRDEAATRIKAAGDSPNPKDLDDWDRAQREAAILEGPVRLAASPLSSRPGYRDEWRP